MFNDVVIVQSAVSAFNNAALGAPAFFWWMLLSLPLLAMVWVCAPMIINKLGLDTNNMHARGGIVLSIMTFLWVVLFGGNYGVLRDSVSVLPFMTATIVFLTSLFVGSHMRDLNPFNISRMARVGLVAVLIIALGVSDMHAWWGPLLQIGACGLGWFMGRAARGAMRPVAGMILIMMMVTIAMLMQPEFFRFGQLGNLTPVHMLFILMIGVCGMATIALNNINARGRIRRGIYMKLKWLMRVISVLMAALFVLTESVPLFVGLCVATFIMFALSIYHASSVPNDLMDKVLAITIILFGAITVMPVVSAIGIVYWAMLPNGRSMAEIRTLL